MPLRLALRRAGISNLTQSARQKSLADVAASSSRRHASSSAPRRFLSTTLLVGGGVALVAYYYDSRSLMHEHVVMPIVRLFDPETGHKLAIKMLSLPSWARPRDRGVDGAELQAELFGLPLSNPVGIAAGFDKDGEAIDGLFDLGFGYVEIGSVTPEPQPGNPQPRFFRLVEDEAAINRYGFNSLGHGQTLARLRARLLSFYNDRPSLFPSADAAPLPSSLLPPPGNPRSLRPGHILAVNLGKNKTSAADSNEDYVRGVRMLGPYADVVVVNVSSPNTPGLRALQGRAILERLLGDVVTERNKIAVDGLPKIAVKVACDLSEDEIADVASAVRSAGIDGVIISNTTVRRKELDLKSSDDVISEVGGLSGRPLFPYALGALKTLRPLLPPSIPIIGAGGISSGEDALAFARAGASIVQVYTHFGYRGVGTPRLMKDEISRDLVAARGGSTWKSQVGKDWGKGMGWDEERVSREGEALRKEAEDLGSLLASINEKEDTARLVSEAQAALANVPGTAPEPTKTAEPSKEPATERPVGLVEQGTAVATIEQASRTLQAIEQPQEPDLPPVTAEALLPEPEAPEPPAPRGEADPWASAVQQGQRRLV